MSKDEWEAYAKSSGKNVRALKDQMIRGLVPKLEKVRCMCGIQHCSCN